LLAGQADVLYWADEMAASFSLSPLLLLTHTCHKLYFAYACITADMLGRHAASFIDDAAIYLLRLLPTHYHLTPPELFTSPPPPAHPDASPIDCDADPPIRYECHTPHYADYLPHYAAAFSFFFFFSSIDSCAMMFHYAL